MSPRALLVASLACFAVAGATGCNKLLGIEDTTSTPDEPVDPLACADVTVASTLGQTAVDTEAASDDFAPSCGDAGGRDQSFAFTAPVTDYYVFDTFDSGFDTVLALYDSCDGSELVCSNNVGATPQSELVRKLDEGQKVLVVVDGFAGDSGTGMLDVARVTCPDADLEGQALPINLSTVSFGDDASSACGGAGHEDRAYHWVAPKDGVYAFSVVATSFTPTLSLIDGPRCSDTSLGCNAAAPGIGHAEVVRRLRAGQSVGIEVDGKDGAGSFSIDVRERAGTCPAQKLLPGVTLPGERATTRTLAPSCSPVEVSGMFGGRFDLPDKTYSLDVPPAGADCFSQCSIDLDADDSMVLYVLEGSDCSGRETSCVLTQVINGRHRASVTVNGDDLETTPYTVVAAQAVPDSASTFNLGSQCFVACP